MSFVESVKAEFHKSPLLAASAVAAVVGAVVLVTRHGTGGTPLTSPLGPANPLGNLPGAGSSGGGGGAGTGQGDPAAGVQPSSVPQLSPSDVAAAINQAVIGLSGSISSSQGQLQDQINQLAGAISRNQSVNEVPRTPVATGASPTDSLIQQLIDRVSRMAPATQIVAPTQTAAPQITAAPRLVANDGQSLFGQSPQTIANFQAAYGAGAATAWVQQHEQELLNPPQTAVTAYSTTPAVPGQPPADLPPLTANPIAGSDPASLVTVPQPVAIGVNLPQPLNPTPGVDYGPPTAPAPEPPSPGAQANIAAYIAATAGNPSNNATTQPTPVDAPSNDEPVARAQTSHVRIE